MSNRFRHAIALAALAALLAACSSVARLAYNNASFATAWVVDDWVDLHDGQRDWVRGRVERLLAWHRANELPAYQRLLHDTAMRASTRIREEDARRVHAEMRELYRRMLEHALPDVADFFLLLHPEQVARLERKFAEDNGKVVKESVKGTPAERREARNRRYLARVEDFTGKLSAPQRDLVHDRVAAIPDFTDEWMGDRRFRQSETMALIRARPSREAMVDGLRRILLDTDSWRRPAYVAKLKERDEQVFAMIAALDATLSAEQRSRMHRTLAGYAGDIAYLMAAN